MNSRDFEGTLVLEKLAEIEKVDDFFDAIDSDDFERARSLMEDALVEEEMISETIKKMALSDHNH
jgi:uncharacterized protein with HEPN domain